MDYERTAFFLSDYVYDGDAFSVVILSKFATCVLEIKMNRYSDYVIQTLFGNKFKLANDGIVLIRV